MLSLDGIDTRVTVDHVREDEAWAPGSIVTGQNLERAVDEGFSFRLKNQAFRFSNVVVYCLWY